jgi:flavin reductase (DIM6/NTAB) family NADH-FMN oxidoreductase RutF
MDQGFDAGAADPRQLRDAFGRFATGVTVVTIAGPDGPMGFTANSFTSLSLDPPLLMWAPAKAASRFAPFAEAPHFAIHVLAREQRDLCRRFARGGAGFQGLDPVLTAEGVPVLDDALARFDCAHDRSHDAGDHVIIVGRILRARLRDGEPLVFSQGHYGGFVPTH